MTAEELVYDLCFCNYRLQRNLGSSAELCAHPLAFGPVAAEYEARYLAELAESARGRA